MSTPTLLEAHQRFTAVLDELRRKYVGDFDQWVKTAFAGDVGASQKEAGERIATARQKFADEFLDQRAPTIIRSYNRDAERDIIEALRGYEARPEPTSPRLPAAGGPLRWQANLWRTILAAAFGAIAAVILLALQPVGEAPKAPPNVQQPGPNTPGAKVVAPPPVAPAVQTEETAQPPVTPPPPPPPPITITREQMVLWLLAAAFVAALGSAIGVFIVACPPVHALLERAGIAGVPLLWARKLGAVFAIFRAGALIALAAALLTGFFALISWLLGGSKPLHVGVGLTALAAILIARWTAPDSASPDRNAIRRSLVGQLDDALKADANVWAALAAALVLKRNDGVARIGTDLKEITNIILARRQQNEAGEDILQVVEQHLGLPSGPAKVTQKAAASEFVWKSEHAHDYNTFGAVAVGDLVVVSSRPLYIEDGSGGRRVSQKGVVTRKR